MSSSPSNHDGNDLRKVTHEESEVALEMLQNLIYLIEICSNDPFQVKQYCEMAGFPLGVLKKSIWPPAE